MSDNPQAKIRAEINKLMHEGFEIPLDQLKADAKLYDDLSLDSLDAVDMIVHLEETLGIKVEAERFMHVRTLGDVYGAVETIFSENREVLEEKFADQP